MYNPWIENDGSSEVPEGVTRGTLVDVRYRDGVEFHGITARLGRGHIDFKILKSVGVEHNHRIAMTWFICGTSGDIVMWRLHKPGFKSRQEARDFCKQYPHYHVVDNGKGENLRWGVSCETTVKEI